jgi:hypothetical protein
MQHAVLRVCRHNCRLRGAVTIRRNSVIFLRVDGGLRAELGGFGGEVDCQACRLRLRHWASQSLLTLTSRRPPPGTVRGGAARWSKPAAKYMYMCTKDARNGTAGQKAAQARLQD